MKLVIRKIRERKREKGRERGSGVLKIYERGKGMYVKGGDRRGKRRR